MENNTEDRQRRYLEEAMVRLRDHIWRRMGGSVQLEYEEEPGPDIPDPHYVIYRQARGRTWDIFSKPEPKKRVVAVPLGFGREPSGRRELRYVIYPPIGPLFEDEIAAEMRDYAERFGILDLSQIEGAEGGIG